MEVTSWRSRTIWWPPPDLSGSYQCVKHLPKCRSRLSLPAVRNYRVAGTPLVTIMPFLFLTLPQLDLQCIRTFPGSCVLNICAYEGAVYITGRNGADGDYSPTVAVVG